MTRVLRLVELLLFLPQSLHLLPQVQDQHRRAPLLLALRLPLLVREVPLRLSVRAKLLLVRLPQTPLDQNRPSRIQLPKPRPLGLGLLRLRVDLPQPTVDLGGPLLVGLLDLPAHNGRVLVQAKHLEVRLRWVDLHTIAHDFRSSAVSPSHLLIAPTLARPYLRAVCPASAS